MLVHHPQLVGAQPMRLAQQPAPDRPDADERNGERADGQCRDRGSTVHASDRRGSVWVMPADTSPTIWPDCVAHRRDRADRRAERAGVDLGERLAAQRRLDGAEVLAADLAGIGVGEPGAVGRHDRDERDIGVGPHRLGRPAAEPLWPVRIRSPRRSTVNRPARWRCRSPAGARRRHRHGGRRAAPARCRPAPRSAITTICSAIAWPASDRGHHLLASHLRVERNELKRDLAHVFAEYPCRPHSASIGGTTMTSNLKQPPVEEPPAPPRQGTAPTGSTSP